MTTAKTRRPPTSRGRSQWWNNAVPKGAQRSTFEYNVVKSAERRGLPLEYEPKDAKLEYKLEYLPDIRLPNGVIVECKGYFDSSDRTKMLRVKKNNPDVDIRMLFQRDNKIIPKSSTTYTGWCQKHGFPCAVGIDIPDGWWD